MNEYESACSSTTISPQGLSVNFTPIKDAIKESVEKLEQHIDQLEEDIEFFNQHRIQQEEEIDRLRIKLDAAETRLAEQGTNITFLKSRESFFTSYTSYLEGRIAALEDKLNDKKVC